MIEKRSTLIFSFVSLATVLVTLLGWLQSPVEKLTGRPMLLIPEVKAIADYQGQARGWVDQLLSLDAAISGLQMDDSGDLFSQSQQGNQALRQAVLLAQTVDQTKAPGALGALHGELKATSLAYLEATRLTLRAIGAPSTDNQAAAETALSQARQYLDAASQSEWINR